MAEPQLSGRSAKARDLARRLARRKRQSIADIVERALEAYEIREAGREPAAVFYARLAEEHGSDLDLEAVVRQNRKEAPGTAALILLDTNIISETLRKTPSPAVIAWLARNDAEVVRGGRPMTAPDGMIAAIARINGGRPATRSLTDFETTGLEIVSPGISKPNC